MKKRLLKIGSLWMALYVLFVTLDLNVNFHYCLEDHHVTSSFGDASEHCAHCIGHHHHEAHRTVEEGGVLHFGAKCCCEDFDSEIAFEDAFTFSTSKPLAVYLPVTVMATLSEILFDEDPTPVFRCFFWEKTSYLLTGRLKTIFYSHLKLNPLVF